MTDHRDPQQRGTTGIVDLLDRVVYRGITVNGDGVVSLASVDMLRLDLRLLLTPAEGEGRPRPPAPVRGTVT